MGVLLYLLLVLFVISTCQVKYADSLAVRTHLHDGTNQNQCNSWYCIFPFFSDNIGRSFTNEDACSRQINAPIMCTDALQSLKKIHLLLHNHVNITQGEVDAFNFTLKMLCDNCLGYIYNYYLCSNDLESFDIIQRVGCSKHERGGYCPAHYLEMEYMMHISVDDCNVTDVQSCSDGCYAYLNDTKEELGCCAVSLFNSTSNKKWITSEKFKACEISLSGDACDFTSVSGSARIGAFFNVIDTLILSFFLIAMLL
jgi:hypothetical protein